MAEFATVARPYAKAIYGLAQQYDQVGVWGNNLALMAKVVSEPKVAKALAQPELNATQRADVLLKLILSSERMFDKRYTILFLFCLKTIAYHFYLLFMSSIGSLCCQKSKRNKQ